MEGRMKETSYLQGREELVGKLKKLPSLTSFKDEYIKEILALSKIRKYEPGEVVIQEGQYDSWMYVLISGEVKVVKGGEVISRLSGIGDIFGEMGIIDGEARSASIFAVSPVTCLAIDASFLDRMTSEDRNAFYSILYRLFAEVLAIRLRETDRELSRTKKELERLRGNVPGAGATSIYNP